MNEIQAIGYMIRRSVLEEIINRAFAKAPYTISGLAAGSILGGLIAGSRGALFGGIVLGSIGAAADLEEQKPNSKSSRNMAGSRVARGCPLPADAHPYRCRYCSLRPKRG